MRLKITLEAPGPFFLPWRYPELLRGTVYSALRRWDPELAESLHSQGLAVDGRRYKPFTYSWLRPRSARAQGEGLLMEPPVHWWVSSPIPQVLEGVVGPLLTVGQVNLGHVILTVGAVEVEAEPAISLPLVVESLSPIVASTVVERDGKLERRFLSPTQEEFQRVISQNLVNKARALGHPAGDGARVRLEPIGEPRSRLVTVNGINVRGYEGLFRAQGDPLLLQVGYDMGFGERNAQGFGMVRLRGDRGRVRRPSV
ncbi:hypothetical protein HRbin25_00547 [bacterium HR25]|nr:hypothetical protein HRbin25_00547 [bacterium HR25]